MASRSLKTPSYINTDTAEKFDPVIMTIYTADRLAFLLNVLQIFNFECDDFLFDIPFRWRYSSGITVDFTIIIKKNNNKKS